MRKISLPVILSLMLTSRITGTLFMFSYNVNASFHTDLRSRSSEATFNLLDKNLISGQCTFTTESVHMKGNLSQRLLVDCFE